uniref:carbonic anhydrase n=2 Tax=Gouania willdenowi TaxID=441366 RepID=A0A8C5GWN6_GOUWI
MYRFVVSALFLCALVPNADLADDSGWCYHLPSCGYTTWPTNNAPYCNGTRQSPININTDAVTFNSNLTAFVLNNYNATNVLTKIENTNRTIKVTIGSGVTISGGGLGESYDSLQFHLHWGNRTSVLGSEHTRNGVRYPMELHIVNSKSSFNGDTSMAVKDPAGLAALGFFIEAMPGTATQSPASWATLTSYLANITLGGQSVAITHPISLNSLLPGVDFSEYYRYNGSLTTPACNEAVVWTVFKSTIKVSSDVIDRFSTMLRIGDSSSELMVNVYRGLQTPLPVQRSFNSSSTAVSSISSLVLVVLLLVLGNS